jgi:uncharacterized protein
MLVNLLKRARELKSEGIVVPATTSLDYFLNRNQDWKNSLNDQATLEAFAGLDDYDIFASAKEWMNHSDKILSELSRRLINRKLFKIRIENAPIDIDLVRRLRKNGPMSMIIRPLVLLTLFSTEKLKIALTGRMKRKSMFA